MMRTPGITGYCGKCPLKNGSLIVTFLMATIVSSLVSKRDPPKALGNDAAKPHE